MSDTIRLLACKQCQSIEELPPFDGPPEHDTLLTNLVQRHRTNGMEHIGSLFNVEASQWEQDHIKKELVKQIAAKMEGGETGLGHEYYDLKNTFQDDAMTCYTAHLRNPACSDYRSESKRLSAGTNAERRAEGLPEHRSNRFLCDFCPVNSLVEAARNRKLGIDK